MKNLIVECWDEKRQNELREMNYNELSKLIIGYCYSEKKGLYLGGEISDRQYIVLIDNNTLNEELIPYSSKKTHMELINKYNIPRQTIYNNIKNN